MRNRRALALVIRIGVVVSFALLAVGLALSSSSAAPETLHPSSLPGLAGSLSRGESGSWIHAGLLMLMLTPLARIVVLSVQFARAREFPFLAVSLGVLLMLIGTVVARLF